MLFATLGKLDLITVMILMGAAFLPQKLLLFAAVYLLAKGLIFILMSKDIASYIDFFSGVYLFVLSQGIKVPYVHNLVLLWLLQKTMMTFIAISFKLFIYYSEYSKRIPG